MDLYFKTNKFQFWKLVLVLDWMLLLLLEGTWINQSITSGGSLSGFSGRTGFHELRRRIECSDHKVFLIKCIKVIGKENLGMIFINKRKQLFEEIDDLDDLIWFILMLLVIVCNQIWRYCQYSKKCMMHSKQWRTSYLCCSWCS
jgi:hypothetical protein